MVSCQKRRTPLGSSSRLLTPESPSMEATLGRHKTHGAHRKEKCNFDMVKNMF